MSNNETGAETGTETSAKTIEEPVAPSSRDDRLAVIDIGSNSIRLVIYASQGRYPFPLFNERANCRLGGGMSSDNMLRDERIAVALSTLSRFASILVHMGVKKIYPVATAAVRRAKNAAAFTGPAEQILGQPVAVLSQAEEARFVAEGINLNIPNANGFVADLGGGSLEVVALEKGKITQSVSFDFGHLSDVSNAEIDAAFADHKWLATSDLARIYGVGGSFRALGSAYIAQSGYPLGVLHGLNVPSDAAQNMLSAFSRAKTDLSGVPMGRQRTMPMASRIMSRLLAVTGVQKITVSGTSIRDGIIADYELNERQRADFLLAISQEISAANRRFADVPAALFAVLQPLNGIFGNGTPAQRARFDRLLEVACYLSDMCWNEHQDVRGDLGARRVLGLPANCITHKERLWLATAIFHRYVGRKTTKIRPSELGSVLGRQRRAEATMIGIGLRFLLTFSGGAAAGLKGIHLTNDGTVLTLHVAPQSASMMDDHAARRFTQLAQSANLVPNIIGI